MNVAADLQPIGPVSVKTKRPDHTAPKWGRLRTARPSAGETVPPHLGAKAGRRHSGDATRAKNRGRAFGWRRGKTHRHHSLRRSR